MSILAAPSAVTNIVTNLAFPVMPTTRLAKLSQSERLFARVSSLVCEINKVTTLFMQPVRVILKILEDNTHPLPIRYSARKAGFV